MKGTPVQSAIALMLLLAITVALVGWLTYGDQGAVTETVEVGTAGIRKAEEIKRLLEESSQAQPEF